jgi:hypothetical protein
MSMSRGHRLGIKEQGTEVVRLHLVSNLHGTFTIQVTACILSTFV